MKVTVTKYLNVRVGKPSVNAPCYQYLAPGSELEIDGKEYPGDTYNDINIWYRDEANNYYWSGGVSDFQKASSYAKADMNSCWWLTEYRIPELWAKGLTGKGIKIAMLDTGLSLPHPDLNIDESSLFDATNSEMGIQDLDGHGTHCAGIIKGSNNGFGVTGISFNCDFHFAKIYDDYEGDANIEPWIKGFEWAIERGVDIISFSRGKQKDLEALRKVISKAISNKILVVAAAGNNNGQESKQYIDFPARYPEVLSVGGLNKDGSTLDSTIYIKETSLFAPGFQIKSTFRNEGYCQMTGSSQATPFVAGVSALLLEKMREKDPRCTALDLKEKLIAFSDSTNGTAIIDPIKTLENL